MSSAGSGSGSSSPAARGGSAAWHQPDAKLHIFEFNNHTTPQRRHKLIKEFQDSSAPGARVFIVTYAVAAVGIHLG